MPFNIKKNLKQCYVNQVQTNKTEIGSRELVQLSPNLVLKVISVSFSSQVNGILGLAKFDLNPRTIL